MGQVLVVRCDPEAVDLRRVAVEGGVVVTSWTPSRGARVRTGEAVVLDDGRIAVLARLVGRHRWRRRSAFRVRALQPADRTDGERRH